MRIETKEKAITINNVTYPKGIFNIVKANSIIRLDFVATNENIDISSDVTIDGVEYSDIDVIYEILQENSFNDGGVTSEWVTEQIVNAQLEGEEIDLSIYAKKTDLTPLSSSISSLQNNKLNISDWTPYKNKVDQLNTQTELNLQFAQISESIRDLDSEKVNRNELSNEYTTLELFDNQNALNSTNFALKTQLNDFALKSELPTFNIYTGIVNASSGVWTINFPEGKFTTPPLVFATAISESGNSSNRANFASVDSVTITGATGMAKRSVSAGLLAAMEMTNADCKVQILAIGQ